MKRLLTALLMLALVIAIPVCLFAASGCAVWPW
jgi:hypothetical protein